VVMGAMPVGVTDTYMRCSEVGHGSSTKQTEVLCIGSFMQVL
jgi:hypothetical protein